MDVLHKAAIATAYVLDAFTLPTPACLRSVPTHAEADIKIDSVVADINKCTKGELNAGKGDSGMTVIGAVFDNNWIEAKVDIPGLQSVASDRVSTFSKTLEGLTGLRFTDRGRSSLHFQSDHIARHFEGASIGQEIDSVERNIAALTSYTQIAFLIRDNAATILNEISALRVEAKAAQELVQS